MSSIFRGYVNIIVRIPLTIPAWLCYNNYKRQVEMVIKPLSELVPGEKGRIVKVGGGKGIRRRLLDMGVVSGAMVEVQRVAPLGDPVEIRVKGYDLALRMGEAANIKVELIEGLP
jgi:Fe2+ transport system protein FeoA